MQEELDPQPTPEGEVVDAGQGEPEVKSPEAPVVDDGQALKERLEKLEKSYQEAQRLIGRQGRELGELRKVAAPRPAVQEEAIPPETFFADPVSATAKVVTRALSEFEARQEGKRQAERYLRSYGEANGMTESQILELNERYESALNDPQARLDLLRDIYRAQNASEEIQKAAQTAKDTVTRNARAVTSEGTATRVAPPGKSFSDMSGPEMREYIKRNYGESNDYL